jgi:hypothetical protein
MTCYKLFFNSLMTTIRWGRIIGLAIALEAVLFVTLVPLISRLGHVWLMTAIAAGCAIFGYVAGRLAARGLQSDRLLHGLLVGIIATAIYLAINVFQPGGIGAALAFYGATLFVAVNALRIVGCLAGAYTFRALPNEP